MTPPSDPGAVPLGNWDEDVWASSSSSYHRRNFNTPGSLTDTVPIRSPQTLHRRRTSENANTASPTTVSGVVQHSRVESSDSVRGHPLGREADGGQHPSSFNDPTVTRPILNFWLSPAPAAGADTDPSEAEHEEGTDSGEKEELVLIHEVNSFSLRIRWTILQRFLTGHLRSTAGYYNRLASRGITEVRHFNG